MISAQIELVHVNYQTVSLLPSPSIGQGCIRAPV
jgi:hypothetical protein